MKIDLIQIDCFFVDDFVFCLIFFTLKLFWNVFFFVVVYFCVASFDDLWIVCLYVESTYSTRYNYFIITNNLRTYFCFLNRSRFFNFKDCRVCSFVENFLLDFVLNLFVFRRFATLSNLRSSRSFSNLTIASFAFSKYFIDFHEFSYDDEFIHEMKYWNWLFLTRLFNIFIIFHFFSFFINIDCDFESWLSQLYQNSNKKTWNTKCMNLYRVDKSNS